MTIEDKQRLKCAERSAHFTPSPLWLNSGLAFDTKERRPIHGLRHPVTIDTTGWYIWCGEFSESPDFFKPVHTAHLEQILPEVLPFLGLPPGYRFLLADSIEDIWFDDSLLAA